MVTLSFRKNAGYGDVSPMNVLCFALAMISIFLWQTTDSPLLALICVLIADGIGAMMVLIKSYKHPHTETASMWVVGILSTFLNLFTVGKLDWALLASPIQLFLFNVGIVTAIVIGRNRDKKKKKKRK